MASKKNFKQKLNSGKEKPFKREETSSRTWLITGDLPAEGQPSKERKEEGDRTERIEDREGRGTNILAILYRTKYSKSNYP